MTNTWPPRWTGPQFKTGVTSRVERRQKRANEKIDEEKNKREVRTRDKRRCRFPLCGCRRLKILAHVAHSKHKGIGGNPAGDRSAPELMILVCACRHRENVISLDRGTLCWRELKKGHGANGPVAWYVRASELPARLRSGLRLFSFDDDAGAGPWAELFRETAIGVGVPMSGKAVAVLQWLATMEV